MSKFTDPRLAQLNEETGLIDSGMRAALAESLEPTPTARKIPIVPSGRSVVSLRLFQRGCPQLAKSADHSAAAYTLRKYGSHVARKSRTVGPI